MYKLKFAGEVILASSSPRRKMLLQKITDNFLVITPKIMEIEVVSPYQTAINNAVLKGDSVKGYIVVACDTIVALGRKIFGKPSNFDNAFAMLKELSGKTHSVISGVYVRCGEEKTIFAEESKVTVCHLTDEEIKSYIEKYKPYDKAGGYGIQDGIIVEKYVGSYDNIVGLPTERLFEVLSKYGSTDEK